MKQDEVCFQAEGTIRKAMDKARKIHELETKLYCTAMQCGPSGLVCCSHESRGSGLRRRSGHMEDIAFHMMNLIKQKNKLLEELLPVRNAFCIIAGTRSAHVIYQRFYKGLSAQQYGQRFHYSRRHSGRLYIMALYDFTTALALTEQKKEI